eukprot:COSAG01_NODE_24597_length_773_cov_1.473294_2_plen_216_part_01
MPLFLHLPVIRHAPTTCDTLAPLAAEIMCKEVNGGRGIQAQIDFAREDVVDAAWIKEAKRVLRELQKGELSGLDIKPPTKPVTVYNLWTAEHRKMLEITEPDLVGGARTKRVNADWKAVQLAAAKGEKCPAVTNLEAMVAEALVDRRRYERETVAYDEDMLTEEERQRRRTERRAKAAREAPDLEARMFGEALVAACEVSSADADEGNQLAANADE